MFNVSLFLQTLPIMGMGMFGIFCVIAVIMISVMILNKVTGKKKNNDQ